MFLEQAYPNARFILSVRNSPEQWYDSLVRSHSKKFGLDGRIPTKEDLEKAKRPHGRTPYMNLKMRFGTPDDNIYDKDVLIKYYNSHCDDVMDYFRLFPDKLLVLNLSDQGAYKVFCNFIGAQSELDTFPWLNKS